MAADDDEASVLYEAVTPRHVIMALLLEAIDLRAGVSRRIVVQSEDDRAGSAGPDLGAHLELTVAALEFAFHALIRGAADSVTDEREFFVDVAEQIFRSADAP
jgi:hypothetical protein